MIWVDYLTCRYQFRNLLKGNKVTANGKYGLKKFRYYT